MLLPQMAASSSTSPSSSDADNIDTVFDRDYLHKTSALDFLLDLRSGMAKLQQDFDKDDVADRISADPDFVNNPAFAEIPKGVLGFLSGRIGDGWHIRRRGWE